MRNLDASVLGVFLFLSVSIGGSIAWFVSKLFQNSTEGLSLLCGGFLVGLLVLDIIPTALAMYKPLGILLGVVLGYLCFRLLNNLFHATNPQRHSVYLLAIAMLLHTIPLSMSIGNLLGESIFAITLTTSTILHHLPEGFALTSALLSQGEKLWGLLLCFVGLSVFFSLFIWIGHHLNISIKAQSILLGVSIGLLATTSVKEFILNNVRTVRIKPFITYIVMGYLLSHLFHLLV